jgi:hypothetical protein
LIINYFGTSLTIARGESLVVHQVADSILANWLSAISTNWLMIGNSITEELSQPAQAKGLFLVVKSPSGAPAHAQPAKHVRSNHLSGLLPRPPKFTSFLLPPPLLCPILQSNHNPGRAEANRAPYQPNIRNIQNKLNPPCYILKM